jgi:hypothetical protein
VRGVGDRELACLKTIFNQALKNGKAERNPAQGVKMLRENNERDRVVPGVCPPADPLPAWT